MNIFDTHNINLRDRNLKSETKVEKEFSRN